MWSVWNDTVDPLRKVVVEFVLRGTESSVMNFIGGYFHFMKYGFSSNEACDEICTVSFLFGGLSCRHELWITVLELWRQTYR